MALWAIREKYYRFPRSSLYFLTLVLRIFANLCLPASIVTFAQRIPVLSLRGVEISVIKFYKIIDLGIIALAITKSLLIMLKYTDLSYSKQYNS